MAKSNNYMENEKFYFENTEGIHNKFWAISIITLGTDNYELVRRWGAIGTSGQVMKENYNNYLGAVNRKDKLIQEKLAKGYRPIL